MKAPVARNDRIYFYLAALLEKSGLIEVKVNEVIFLLQLILN